MKIRIMSDIHFTDGINGHLPVSKSAFYHYYKRRLKYEENCVTLIAGDMATGLDYTDTFLKTFFPKEPVIFIEGNHLVYQKRGKTLTEYQDELREKYPKDHLLYHYLENDWMFLPFSDNNVAVIGSTFFTNYEFTEMTVDDYNAKEQAWHKLLGLYGFDTSKHEFKPVKKLTKKLIIQDNMRTAEESLNDFQWGWETPSKRLSPAYYLELHNKAKAEIERCYSEITAINPNCKIILMTHHCLSPQCIDARFVKHRSNASYVSDLEDWVKHFENVRLIVSGHVHCRKNFTIGDKRYIINAMGYCMYNEPFTPKEAKFNPNLIIDTNDL